ncbi:hypothetical protein GQ457_09G025340 [Hibiscus cannabinus]
MFGFVRFTNIRDADRAIERLNGFNLFGSIIHVGYALFNDHTSHWRNDHPSSSRPIAKGSFAVKSETKEPFSEPVKDEFLFTGKTREANLQKSRLSRIQGHVEEETLAKLKKRVIGLMATDSSTEEPVCPKEKQSSKLVEEKNVQIEESSSSESSSKRGRSFSDAGKGESKSCDLLGKCEGRINEKRTNILNDQRKPSTCEAFEIEDVSKSGTTESPNLGGCELLEEEDKEADIACAAATKEAQDLRCTVDYPNTNYVDPGGKMSITGDRRCCSVSKNNKVDLSDEDEVHGLGGCGSNRNMLVNASPIDFNRVKGLGGCNVESERLLSVDGNNEREVITNRALGDILNMGLGSELNEDLCEMGPCPKEGLSWARKVDLANGKTDAYDFEREVDLEQESMFPELLDYRTRLFRLRRKEREIEL